MTLSKDIRTYDDMREAADRALAAPNGIRLRMAKGKAIYFRQRFYTYRQLTRIEATKTNPGDYGTSPYEHLGVNLIEDGDEAVVELVKLPAPEIEEI